MGKRQGIERVVARTLLQVAPKAKSQSWNLAAERRPKCAVAAACVISDFARVEAEIADTFVYMLGVEPAIGAAMYQALGTWAPRRDAMNAVARLTYPEAADVWSAILQVFKARAEERNVIVHHMWGFTRSLPHSLLICDPKHFFDSHVQNSTYMARHRAGLPVGEVPPSPYTGQIAPQHIRVYRVKDFERIRKKIRELSVLLKLFGFYVWAPEVLDEFDDGGRAGLLKWLSKKREIRAVLGRQIQNQQTPPVVPQRTRGSKKPVLRLTR